MNESRGFSNLITLLLSFEKLYLKELIKIRRK